jgi:hypothetical protein
MFLDESIYLYWARRVAADFRFWRPLADGKSLHIWLLAPVVPWAGDPLLAGRLVSVAVGAVGAWVTWKLGARFGGSRAGTLAAALYVLCPHALFLDRMVLADVHLSTAAGLTLLASVTVLERPTGRRASALGVALAACVLSKIPGLLCWATPPLAAALLERPRAIRGVFFRAYGTAAALAGPPVVYFFLESLQVQEQLAFPPSATHAALLLLSNLRLLGGWLWDYWTPGLCLVGAGGLLSAVAGRRRPDALLAAVAAVPLLVFAGLSRSWFPRYLSPATIPFLVLVAMTLVRLARWVGFPGGGGARRPVRMTALAAAGLLAAAPALRFDHLLMTRPEDAPFPAVDRGQYVLDWSAGYGCEDVARALLGERTRSSSGLVVGVGGGDRHDWRPLHLLLRARFMNDEAVEIEVLDPFEPVARAGLFERAEGRPVYVAVALGDGREPAPPGYRLVVGRSALGVPRVVLYRALPPAARPH